MRVEHITRYAVESYVGNAAGRSEAAYVYFAGKRRNSMQSKKLEIFDSTLRDGMQGEGVTFSLNDKLKIVRALDDIGVDVIEAGNPASNPKDLEFFLSLQNVKLEHAKICAFGSTCRKDAKASEDDGLAGLISSGAEIFCIFGKASVLQATKVLGVTREENLRLISDSVEYLVSTGRRVIFDAEHFYDGYMEDSDYALACIGAALNAGADTVCLCDTRGGTFSRDISRITKHVAQTYPDAKLGIHCHNDRGLAVANSMAAVFEGASQVQGTFIGIGERCGNANLSTLIPNLQLGAGYECIPEENMQELTPTALYIAEIANYTIPGTEPYIGSSAFAHKGGMHIDGVTKLSESFEHIDPRVVGNRRHFLISEVTGKTGLLQKINKYDPTLTKDSPVTQKIVDTIKELERRGFQFEAAEESFDLIIRRALGKKQDFFELVHFKILGEQPILEGEMPSSAMVKVRVGDETEVTAAEGNGPVHALDLALRKALARFYPNLANVRLTDFKVRVLESSATTAASVRVWIQSSDGNRSWCTVGVSTDIIEASFMALTDSVDYKLTVDLEAEGK